ncbi:MAG: glycosyltransferase family 4 protein, partial [Candidatus Cloacimonetes bacterium]|nr:glycosyltransferase family 4 protein [Candidatus Cloacimonadota bacterium]
MRVGLFSACPFSYPGGVQEHVKALFASLQKKGIYTKILLPGGNGGEQENTNHYYFGSCAPLFSTDTRGNLSFCLNPDLIDEVLISEKFDILHFHSPDAPFLAWQILERSNTINIGTFHTSVEGTLFEEFFLPITRYFQKEIMKKIHGIIVVSNTARSYLPKDINTEIATIPNGVDISRFSPENSPIEKFKDGKINILFVGRFDRRKGVKYLLQAFRVLREKYADIRLVLVGGGALSYWYKMRALADGIPDVEFIGEVP